MKKNILVIIAIFLSFTSCNPQSIEKSALVEQDKSEVLEIHSFPLPDGAVTLNLVKLFEMNGRYYLMAYFYPRHDLYIYDLSKNELVNQLSLGNIHSLNGVEFFSRDSIMLYGSSADLKSDSVIQCVNLEGKIKQVYPLFFSNVISSKIPADPLLANNEELYPRAHFVFDHKIFLTFDYCYYGFKGYQKKYPLVGYYDLLKGSLVVNHDIWYPELDSNRYYAQSFYYQHSISLKENGNIDISFSYTPTIYEWDFKHDKVKEHKVNSKFMSAIPFAERKQKKEDPEFNNFNPIHGLYLPGVSSVMKDKSKIYYREMMLPTAKYGDGKIIRVFFDSKYHYLGESLIDNNYFINSYKSVYYMCGINNGKLDLKFVKPVFKPFDENKLKSKLDSIEKMEIMKNKQKGKEICGIVERKSTSFTYQKDDIVKYFQKNHQIQDTSFSVAIVNSKGCGPCNEYVLKFIKANKTVFFNIVTRPLYVLYVNEGASYPDMTSYLAGFSLTEKNLVKMDNSVTYKEFSPSSLFNPRLVLVSQKKVISDYTYLPDELEKFVNDLLDYYNVIRK